MTHGEDAVGRTAVVEPQGVRHEVAALRPGGPAEGLPQAGPGPVPGAQRDAGLEEVLVVTDDSPRGQRAVSWASREVRLRGGGAPVVLGAGRPVDVLRASARASMLVLGTRPRGRLTWRFRGGLPRAVAAGASCPVVVVRGHDPDIAAEHWKPVVVGVDAHDRGTDVMAFAAHEAQLRHVPLQVVVAWSLPTAAGVGVAHFQGEALEQWARSMADEALGAAQEALSCARAASPGLVVTSEVVNIPAGEALVARSGDAQLLVVGAGGTRHGIGPVPRTLVRRSSCPVAVVPAAPAGGCGSGS